MMPRLALAAFLLIACGARQAAAQTYCTSYTSGLAFGNYNPTADLSVTATVTVQCSSGNKFYIGLDAGTGIRNGPVQVEQNRAAQAARPNKPPCLAR